MKPSDAMNLVDALDEYLDAKEANDQATNANKKREMEKCRESLIEALVEYL